LFLKRNNKKLKKLNNISRDFKDEVMFLMFLLSMTCLAALPCENGDWQFEVP
jgi:hypothetical protein